MLYWSVVFFVLAIIAGFLGFGGFIVGSLVGVAKVLFFVFLVLFVLGLLRNSYNDPYVP